MTTAPDTAAPDRPAIPTNYARRGQTLFLLAEGREVCESHPECDAEWENFLLSDDATSSEIVSLDPRSPSVTTTMLTDLVHEASRALGPS